jgi:hypothetical protein
MLKMRSQSAKDLTFLAASAPPNQENSSLFPRSTKESENFLPPPVQFARSCRRMMLEPAVVFLSIGEKNRHTISSVSQELCDLLEYSKEEMAGRTMKMLAGPETDISMLFLAIKSTSIDRRPIIVSSVKLYGRNGALHEVKVTCELAGDGTCSLQIEWPVTTRNLHFGCLKDDTIYHSARARFNFITGLVIHKAQLRLQSSTEERAKLS